MLPLAMVESLHEERVVSGIAHLRARLQSDAPAADLDHWLGRFVLAHPTLDAAEAAARKSCAFRQESRCDEIRAAIRRDNLRLPNLPHNEVVQKYWSCALCDLGLVHVDGKRPLAATVVGGADLSGLAEALTLDEFKWFMLHVFERRLLVLEEESSRQGEFVRFVDIHECARLATHSIVDIFASCNAQLAVDHPFCVPACAQPGPQRTEPLWRILECGCSQIHAMVLG
jgi:hypothetical protein